MTRRVHVLALCVVVAFGAVTTGCTSTVQGAPVKAQESAPTDVPLLDERDLDGLLLSNSDLNDIAGVELESFYSTQEMNDNADLISDPTCVGAVYPGEEAAYADSGWSAVRDELLLEQGAGDDGHLIEQTMVLFDSAGDANAFFDMSKDVWRSCADSEDITVDGDPWTPEQVQQVDDRLIALKAQVSGSITGTCQHAIGVVSNLIVEGFSCDAADNDDAQTIASRILEDAANN